MIAGLTSFSCSQKTKHSPYKVITGIDRAWAHPLQLYDSVRRDRCFAVGIFRRLTYIVAGHLTWGSVVTVAWGRGRGKPRDPEPWGDRTPPSWQEPPTCAIQSHRICKHYPISMRSTARQQGQPLRAALLTHADYSLHLTPLGFVNY